MLTEIMTDHIKAITNHAQSLDIIWVLISSFLIFFMQGGFTLVEVGFTRAKNAGNVVMKNLSDFTKALGWDFVLQEE